jgi:hypothetical protein
MNVFIGQEGKQLGSDYEQGFAVPKQALDHPVSLPAPTLEMITYLWALSLHEADHLPKSSAKTKTGCRFEDSCLWDDNT